MGYAGENPWKIISKKNTVLNDWFQKKINERRNEGSFRELVVSDKTRVDFTSNDYLGFSRSSALSVRIYERLLHLDIHTNGATGSRLLSGNDTYTQTVEKYLAEIFQAEQTLIFNSGYTANVGVFSSVAVRGDTILYDELAHASIKDGARLSLASRFAFRHNDLHDLETKLKKATGKIFIAVESIYSMDGDECPLVELAALADRYNAFVILDEAHSTGVRGKGGSGLAVELGIHDRIAIRIYTFGKAMGIHGACVAGSAALIQYLINFSRPFIYTTALPPHSITSIECAFQFLSENPELQRTLQERITLFLEQTSSLTNRVLSKSAIQTAIFPGNEMARYAARKLQKEGFDIRPILSPTVPEGKERLRICIHTYNTESEIKALADSLRSL